MSSYQELIKSITDSLRWTARRWALALLLIVLLLNLTAEGPPPGSLKTQIDQDLVGERFDFEGWEVKAVWAKLTHRLVAPQRYLDESTRHNVLLDYLALVAEAQRLDWEIYRIYADPDVEEPDAEAANLQAQLDEVRGDIKDRQLLAEAILQEQVACILVKEGFGALGQEIPPVSVHFTPLPFLLIVSPRDHIERIHSLGLRPGLDVGQREEIEEQVDSAHDVSSLVTGIGGLAAYPAMLLESSSINWVTAVTAHEWTHHYLAPRPLGWSYDTPEARIINETVASIVEKEVGRRVIARYYPEHLPPEPTPEPKEQEPEETEETEEQDDPPAFDFRAEMRETRIRVDELLAQGKIEEAEAYMEQRRQMFVEEGYYIRKLNQAYFAFHGAYADEPGASGSDPIGPAVQDLFVRIPDLHSFVVQVSHVTTLEELEALLMKMEQ